MERKIQISMSIIATVMLSSILGLALFINDKNLCYYYARQSSLNLPVQAGNLSIIFAVKYAVLPVAGIMSFTLLAIWWTEAWHRTFGVLMWFSTPSLVFIGAIGWSSVKASCSG